MDRQAALNLIANHRAGKCVPPPGSPLDRLLQEAQALVEATKPPKVTPMAKTASLKEQQVLIKAQVAEENRKNGVFKSRCAKIFTELAGIYLMAYYSDKTAALQAFIADRRAAKVKPKNYNKCVKDLNLTIEEKLIFDWLEQNEYHLPTPGTDEYHKLIADFWDKIKKNYEVCWREREEHGQNKKPVFPRQARHYFN